MSRNRGFNRDEFTYTSSPTSSWLTEFAAEWEKKATVTAVEAARQRQIDADFYSQISSIVGGNKKHATVESIVEEYQELTGLKKYLKTLAEKEQSVSDNVKTAQDNSKVELEVEEGSFLSNLSPELQKSIKTLVENKIKGYNGFVSIPAIQDELLRSLKNKGLEAVDVYNAEMVNFIGQHVKEYEKNYSSHKNNTNPNLGVPVIEIEDDNKFLPTLQQNR